MPRWQYNGIFVLRSWLRCTVVMVSPPHKWHRVSGKKKTSALFFTTSLVVITWQHSPPHSPLVESSLSPREGPARGHKHSTIRFFFFLSFLPHKTLPQTFLPVPDGSWCRNGKHSTKISIQNHLRFQTANYLPILAICPMTIHVRS